MKPSQVARTLKTLINARQPVMIWGPPGAGKSKVVAQVAKGYGEFIDVRLPLLDAVDLRGIPVVKDGRTEWVTPAMFPRKGKGVLLPPRWVLILPKARKANEAVDMMWLGEITSFAPTGSGSSEKSAGSA